MNPLPEGVRVVLDPSVRVFRHGRVLTGGFPGRLIALSPDGVESLARLTADGPLSEADRRLGRRLVDAGMAHPRLPTGSPLRPGYASSPDTEEGPPDASVTVVIPVRDRAGQLERCLASLGSDHPVVVVDDGSDDPDAVAAVCARRRTRLVRRADNRGPAAARNEALADIESDLVVFVDSDCTFEAGWLPPLVAMFADPDLGAVAPRVRPRPLDSGRSLLAHFADRRSPLDMGDEPSEVGPGRKVRYVPAAALVARRIALGTGFDPGLRFGEDVDLVWRMCDTGWHVRFEPEVTVWHDEPSSWAAWLARRFRYGTSAGPLARRHPGRLSPVELRAWPVATVATVLRLRPVAAGAILLGSAASTGRMVRGQGIPLRVVLRWSAASAGWTMVGLGRALTTLAGPALLLAGFGSRRRAGPAILLLLAAPLADWWRRRPDLDPLRWSCACIVDDVFYGAGVWTGCVRSQTVGPLLPAFRIRQWTAQ